ncbi:MAG: acyltransferase, partial [Maritimibacter sp.]
MAGDDAVVRQPQRSCGYFSGVEPISSTDLVEKSRRKPADHRGPRHGRVLPGIQHLRGWAAAWVVIAHMNGMMGKTRYFGTSPADVETLGAFGVTVFFCISGFIIALVSLDHDLRPKISIDKYARRRFERIVPFLWVCVLGYTALHSLFGPFEPLPMLRALFLWPIGEMRPNVVWSLRHELIFYVLFAATMLGRRKYIWPLVLWCLTPA